MNRNTHLTKLLCLLLLVLGAHFLHAQVAPSFPEFDASINNQIQVNNTGNTTVYYAGNILQLSVWDGHAPAFSWDYNGGAVLGESPFMGSMSSTGQLANDPDIVVGPTNSGKFVIVYELMNRIFYEVWQFNGVTCVNLIGATILSSGTGICRHPNIDQTPESAGIVWEQNGKIKGRTIEMFTFFLGPEIEFGACILGEKSQPDISVYSNGIDRLAHVVFVNRTSGAKQLAYHRHGLAAFEIGLPPSCAFPNFRILKSLPYAEDFYWPRIASTPFDTSVIHDPRDIQIVVTHLYPSSQSEVVGFNHHASTWGAENFNELVYTNAPTNLLNCMNLRPVVSYIGCEQIMIEWIYLERSYGPCLPLTGHHILGRQLDRSGIPSFPNYSRVSFDLAGVFYNVPSVSGRYLSTFGSTMNIFSTYTRSSTHKVRYKLSRCNMVSMKMPIETATAGELQAFPNPFASTLNLSMEIRDPKKVISIDIMNVKGQKLHSFEVADLQAGMQEMTWDAPEYPAGVYLVRLVENDRISTQKVIKH